MNIVLFILRGKFEIFLPNHHNDSNKMKGKNRIDQNPPFGPFKSFFFSSYRSAKCSHLGLFETFELMKCSRCFQFSQAVYLSAKSDFLAGAAKDVTKKAHYSTGKNVNRTTNIRPLKHDLKRAA